jgi:hypothetical protein
VINFLLYFEEDGVIYLETIKEDLKDRSTAEEFRDSFNLWKDDLKRIFYLIMFLKRFPQKGRYLP